MERYLTAYADGELPERLRRRVERHLAECEACARELDSIRTFDKILDGASAPAVSGDRWHRFKSELTAALDRVDREALRPKRIRETRPVFGSQLGRRLAVAGACVVVAIVALTAGPVWFGGRSTGSGVCIVESIETMAAGYTPMTFRSNDPEMTVIWVFSEEVEPGLAGEGPGAM